MYGEDLFDDMIEDLLENPIDDVDDVAFVSENLAAPQAVVPGCDTLRTAAAVAVAPFRYVCSVTLNTTDAVIGGSGTLIDYRTVLCAAHTVFDARHSPGDLKVNFGIPDFSRTPLRFSIGSSVVNAVHIFPKFTDLSYTGYPFDVAILTLRTSMHATVRGYWGKSPRPNFDSRGSRIGSLPGWRPGMFRVNIGGYPQLLLGFQFHCFAPTLPSVTGDSLYLSFRGSGSPSLPGLSGCPVWVTRHRSLGGRHLVGMIAQMDFGSGEIDAVHFARENLDVMRFIKRHARSARFSFSV
jgi:hypothetical protein